MTAPVTLPREPVERVVTHLSHWLNLNECECEGGHKCGRDQVERDADALAQALNATPAPAPDASAGSPFCQSCGGSIEGWICQGCGLVFKESDGRLVADRESEPDASALRERGAALIASFMDERSGGDIRARSLKAMDAVLAALSQGESS